MILVLAGTQDGRELAGRLLDAGWPVAASVVSRYGSELLVRYAAKGLVVNDRPLDTAGLAGYIRRQGIRLLVDASHPYAANASENAMEACRQQHIPYLRYERKGTPLVYDKLYRVADYAGAARQAAKLGQHIFLTTGSHNLATFSQAECLRDHVLTARVLPEPEVLRQCLALGFSPKNLVAMQGPFSLELNAELYKKYEAEVIVTKDSGQIGGTDTKAAAAIALGLPLVLIERPQVSYENFAQSFEEVLAFAAEQLPAAEQKIK